MKKVYKSFALLCVGLATVACVDEPFEDVVLDTTPGNDIVFTAVAANDDLTTKTVYGAPGDGIVPLLWKHGDNIQIASPEAIGENNAEYTIGTQGEADNQNAYSVTKSGDAGLQWSEEDTYHFYAMYPSPATLSNTGVYLDHDKKEMMGLIPMNQQPSNTVLTEGGYTLEPDMRYAYMVAKDTYTRDASGDNVTLAFTPMVTTLQFDITANTIGPQKNDGGLSRLFLTGVSLLSKDKMDETGQTVLAEGKSISGNFTYNFDSDNITIEGNNRINMNFAGTGYELTKNQYCNVTLFLLPQNYPAGTLELQLMFTVGGTTQIRKTTIAIDIQKQKKYVFNDLLMPEIVSDVTGSSWISGLDPQMKISQLSLPVAGNTFANRSYDQENVSEYTQQQSLSYEQLWNMGVRGFEFVNRSTRASYTNVPDQGLRNEKPVCYETVLTATAVPTFGTAFETLVRFFVKPEYSGEFLLLICTYQATGDGYNPDRYVTDLLTYFDYFIGNSQDLVGKTFTKDNFVKLTSQTTIEQLQGNIAVVIRPGDDSRYETNNTTSGISLLSKSNVDWTNNVSLITDWGTAFDVWDRRAEEIQNGARTPVARQSSYETEYYHKTGRPIVEHWLYGQSSTSGSFTFKSGTDSYEYTPEEHRDYNAFNNFAGTTPTIENGVIKERREQLVGRQGGFNYSHAILGGGTAYVQEWARVIPLNLGNRNIYTEHSRNNTYFFVNWPESITEKKQAIDNLFKMSVARNLAETTNDIYINVLSGYFATEKHMPSLLPFQKLFAGFVDRNFSFSDWTYHYDPLIKDQGKGGDSIGLAEELNQYVYDILSGDKEMSSGGKLAKGPWGLIVMDHIQPTDVSADLVKLIMMNNFEVESGGSGSDGSDNEDDPEDEPTTPSAAWAGDYDSAYLDGEYAISFE